MDTLVRIWQLKLLNLELASVSMADLWGLILWASPFNFSLLSNWPRILRKFIEAPYQTHRKPRFLKFMIDPIIWVKS